MSPAETGLKWSARSVAQPHKLNHGSMVYIYRAGTSRNSPGSRLFRA